jgi:hypothetical protein
VSQDKKLINFGGATVGERGVYSIEFHEDYLYGHVKRANPDGTADYFTFNASAPGASAKYENYSDSGVINYIATASTPTPVMLDGNGPFEDKRFSPAWLDHDLYDVNAHKIDLRGVPIGSLVHITYDIELMPTSSNEDIHIFFEFSAFGGYRLYVQDGTMRQQSTTHHYSGTKTFFVINEDVQNEGVRLMVEAGCDVNIVPNFMMIALL